ncbi:hypothetical protein Val02_02920 [Virgisporangium aliadipatigenens]|uniref:Uncharacterized protein n=1 Tax=Virgisporangium aliadipatigenens TaxID=741659 RepID=A0A8J4DN32_9ACTN|nr:hypothetical protein [Virgisporangium aliadipatigenens]GIJ43406.1 hypothetical protein Val02_02920 [Virgisporangium aliadipatigenens]
MLTVQVELELDAPARVLRLALTTVTESVAEQHARVVVHRVAQIHRPGRATPVVRIDGDNLMDERVPTVRIGGARVPIVEATESLVLAGPFARQLGGILEVETDTGGLVRYPLSPAS